MLGNPGLFDLQANGFSGVDFNGLPYSEKEAAAQVDHALEAMLVTGVTCCLPTVITAPVDTLSDRLKILDLAVTSSRLGHLMCPGYHLEGPFLNPAEGFAGCHPSAAMTLPDPSFLERLESRLNRPILLITLAPELAGAEVCIRMAAAREKVVAIGHSNASSEDVDRAASAGARLSTHLGNALPRTLPKLANPIFAQLAEDRLSASFIADGIHLPVPALKAMIRAKGVERSILVTDATAAAAASPGTYSLAGMAIELDDDGVVSLPVAGRPLAGSSLCLDMAVRNLISWKVATPTEAMTMASDNPRRLLSAAFAAHRTTLPPTLVVWSESTRARRVRVGDTERIFSVANEDAEEQRG